MGERNERDVRESIRLATIDLIEREGGGTVTTRAIALAAGVNVAAINYYFRSKDALLSEALETSWNHALDDLRDFLHGTPWDCRKGLGGIAGYLIEGGAKFPNITRAQLLGLGTGTGTGGPSYVAASMRGIIEETAACVGRTLGIDPDETLLLRTGSFFASILYPAILPAAFPPLRDVDSLARYERLLVEDYLSTVVRGQAGVTERLA